MILTGSHFSAIAKAAEPGRGLHDNLARYLRFQTAGLAGYTAAFPGASIPGIAAGVPPCGGPPRKP